MLGGGLGDVTATAAGCATAAPATTMGTAIRAFASGVRAETAGVAGPLDAIEEAAFGALDGIEGVAVAAAAVAGRDQCESDRLALGVGAIELVDRCSRVAHARIGHEGETLGAAGSVVYEAYVLNGSDAGEEILRTNSCQTSHIL